MHGGLRVTVWVVPRAVGVRIWTGGHCLKAFICVLRRQHAAQVRRTIIYCVSKHASFVRMLLQWRTQNWRSFLSWQNELRPTPQRGSRLVEEQLHGAGEESDDPVINKVPCYEDVWGSGGNRSTHSCPRHYEEMTTKEGIPLFIRQEAEWAVQPVRTLEGRYPVAVDSCASLTEPVVVTKLTEQSRLSVFAGGIFITNSLRFG